MATKKKTAAPAAGKKTAPANPILLAAGNSVVKLLEPSIQSITLTVIAELQKLAATHPQKSVLVPFLQKAYAAVLAGSGQEGGEASQDGPPMLDKPIG